MISMNLADEMNPKKAPVASVLCPTCVQLFLGKHAHDCQRSVETFPGVLDHGSEAHRPGGTVPAGLWQAPSAGGVANIKRTPWGKHRRIIAYSFSHGR